jgi:uncharacterized protein
MFFAVKDLELGKVRFSTSLAPGDVEFLDPAIRQTAPLEVSGTAEYRSALQEIRVQGSPKGSVTCACDRCLETTRIPVDGDFDLSYRPSALEPEAGEVALDEDESEVGFFEGAGLDLADIVREQVLLLLPMQRFCRPGCKGLCPVCGKNRNEVECSCRVEPIDERWAALRNI